MRRHAARSIGVLLAPLPEERKPANATVTEDTADTKSGVADANSPAVVRTIFIGRGMRLALFEPDIPQNTGTILRLCGCLGIEAHIVEPAGFPVSDRAFRRAGMDYLDKVSIVRHVSWAAFEEWRQTAGLRLVVFTTHASVSYLDHAFGPSDVLLFGRESAGVPDTVHAAADCRLAIPMQPGLRSINIAMACAMAVGEALRQARR
jgi:tRNA (cytidine/uridine-2'-O-)-methyltransferase